MRKRSCVIMTLRQIQYIVEVERLGSLSNAAKSLFISQSTLSFAIKDLELELGFPLFERTHTGMRPTEGGLVFLKKAHAALSAFGELENTIPSARTETACLRVATVQSGFLPQILQQLTPEFEVLQTPFRLKCKRCGTGEVVDEISGGEYDLGFIYATDRQRQAWKQEFLLRGIEVQKVCTLEVCAIFSEADPFAGRSSVCLSELSDYTFVFSGDDGLTGFSNLADYSAQNFNLTEHRRYFDAQDTLLLNSLLRRPGRFSIGHRSVFPLYSEGLAYVPLRNRQWVYLLALRLKDQPLSQQAERLLTLLRERASDIEGQSGLP
ncbi:MAG: LysR family transcriptional regulator [Ruminococcaceae bacterium]|nr:LysR family transcriptional regulator [Oscillospiraceae bacterium]